MVRVIAVSGKRFFGKDTFASLLQEHARRRGRNLPAYAFANESKRMFVEAQRATGVEVDLSRLLSDRDYKERWRPQLTQFTVEAIAGDALVFCRTVADRIAGAGVPALITDLRLRLEHEHLASRFALHVVRLARSDASRAATGWAFKPGVDDHATETELDDAALWNEVITNDGTLEELGVEAGAIIDAQL